MRQTFQPRTAGERQGCQVRFDLAVHLGAAWALCMGLMLHFAFDRPPLRGHGFFRLRLEDPHRVVGPSLQQFGSDGLLSFVGHDLIGDHGLISIHRHMLHSALAAARLTAFATVGNILKDKKLIDMPVVQATNLNWSTAR
jgi:hypothetical protein